MLLNLLQKNVISKLLWFVFFCDFLRIRIPWDSSPFFFTTIWGIFFFIFFSNHRGESQISNKRLRECWLVEKSFARHWGETHLGRQNGSWGRSSCRNDLYPKSGELVENRCPKKIFKQQTIMKIKQMSQKHQQFVEIWSFFDLQKTMVFWPTKIQPSTLWSSG